MPCSRAKKTQQRVEHFENELKTLKHLQLESVKVRSRAQWIEEGEKPTKFFLISRPHASSEILSTVFTI